MKKYFVAWIALVRAAGIYGYASAPFKKDDLKVIIIRHGEKPPKGDNLSCQGLNRAMQLPAVLHKKFGVPDYVYIPSIANGKSTTHARMFQTVTPLAVKYNLALNSSFDEKDVAGVAGDIRTKKGIVLMVWEHSAIPDIVKAFGVRDPGGWGGSSYDSIWIITFPNGVPTISRDAEGIKPSDKCQ